MFLRDITTGHGSILGIYMHLLNSVHLIYRLTKEICFRVVRLLDIILVRHH